MCQLRVIILNIGRNRRRQQSSIAQQQIEIFLDVGLARANLDEGSADGTQNDQVHGRNPKKKNCGKQRADQSADFPDRIHSCCSANGGPGNRNGSHQNDGGMSQGKHEPDGDRPLAFLHQLAGHIVDGGNMVGIHRMPKAKTVGQKRSA